MSSPFDPPLDEPPLPPGFLSIQDIRKLPNEKIAAKIMIKNIVGFVKDFQPPIPTRGTDMKCTIEIMDFSIRDETNGLKINIFGLEEKMPKISGAADVVLIRNAKVQMWGGGVSLVSNHGSEFHILASSKIPKAALAVPTASWQSYPPGKGKAPSIEETNYVILASVQINDIDLPSDHEFQEKKIQAMNLKDKFSLLKDVKPDGRFHNILGQVVRVYESGDTVSVYLSDYTAHSLFHNYVWNDNGEPSDGRDGDEYGYTKAHSKSTTPWPGPFGKLTIQLTLFDEHAVFMRENVRVEQWVFMSNVKMKYGRDGGKLEGFLHGDNGKVNIKVMEVSEEPDQTDPRWKDAIRRKQEYMKRHEAQKTRFLAQDDGLGNKRKAVDEGPSKKNSKQRRKEKRAALEKAAAELEAKEAAKLNLNDNIRCSFPDKQPTPLKDILTPEMILREDGSCFPSTFTNRKYRANVRVVDYAPNRIEDFAVWRRETEFDMLSDYSGGEETDIEEDMQSYKNGKGYAKKKWEWRFWLRLEDANLKESKERLWVIVDNYSAQGLLGLDDDAANLRKDHNLLAALKEQLFKLWGDLEEKKSARLLTQLTDDDLLPCSFNSTAMLPPRRIGAQPDADSDSESEEPECKSVSLDKKMSALNVRSANTSFAASGNNPDSNDLVASNKTFTCCIQQYGIKDREEDSAKMDAGDCRRWQRMFGLFGTQIQ